MNTTFKKTKDLVEFIYSNDFNESIWSFYDFKKQTIKERITIITKNMNVSKYVARNAAKSI